MLRKIYYLLYSSEFFSDYLFLLEVTAVLLQQLRFFLIIAVKLTLNLLIETESVKQSDSFTVAEWTKQVMLGFVYHVQMK